MGLGVWAHSYSCCVSSKYEDKFDLLHPRKCLLGTVACLSFQCPEDGSVGYLEQTG